MFKGKRVSSNDLSARIVSYVYVYFLWRTGKTFPTGDPLSEELLRQTANATRVGKNTMRKCIQNVAREGEKGEQKKKKKRKVDGAANFLDPEVQYVCTVLKEEIDRRNKAGEFVSLRSLGEWVKKLHHAPGWRFSDVYKLLKARGWVFAKANNYQFLQRCLMAPLEVHQPSPDAPGLTVRNVNANAITSSSSTTRLLSLTNSSPRTPALKQRKRKRKCFASLESYPAERALRAFSAAS